MYIFEAQYLNVDTCKTVTRSIELQAVGSDRDIFIKATMVAYDGASDNEELVGIELIAC